MKAFFIFRDSELIGNPIGYTTKDEALISLIGCIDWHKCRENYSHFYNQEDIPEEYKINGLYKETFDKRGWIINNENWSRTIWMPYVNEHYNIIEKEFDIVFRN